jgi:ABC-type thiamine transport system substrate-binding protein
MPVQENYNITSFTGVDVVNTSTGYVAYISQKKSITGTGISLKILTANNPKSPITYALSCRDINDN